MACPICGASCKCRNQGPGGLCCGCHAHTARRRALERKGVVLTPELEEHLKKSVYYINRRALLAKLVRIRRLAYDAVLPMVPVGLAAGTLLRIKDTIDGAIEDVRARR